jgi:hypothetical protein
MASLKHRCSGRPLSAGLLVRVGARVSRVLSNWQREADFGPQPVKAV